MSELHQIGADAVVAATIGLVVATAWSLIAGRRSRGRRDHRFAVDRLVLAVAGLVALNELLGVVLLGGGARPADPLHLLYGVAALVTAPVGWWLGGRPRPAGASRLRRDAWVLVAAVLLLGVELRLFMTG